MDMGARLDGYCSDMTRTVALGSVPPRLKNIWQIVLDPQGGAVSSTLPVQVSVAVPLAPSVVTGLPPWVQTVDVVGPPG